MNRAVDHTVRFMDPTRRDLTAIDTPKARRPTHIPATTYFVNAEPASLSEAGPSAT